MNVRRITALAALPVALFTLAACGGQTPAAQTADAPPATVTKTVTKPVTPAVCLTALDRADTALTTAGEGFDVVADVLTAASNLDVDGMTAATEKLTPLSAKLSAQLDAYKTARDECKAAG
jgi:hypothetical protein